MIHDPDEHEPIEHLPCQQELIEEREWDCLAVLDACRWDALHDLRGDQVRKVRTPAERSTPDWMSRVWDKKGWKDVTYVSGNPQTEHVKEMQRYQAYISHRVDEHIKAWEEQYDVWDNILGTARPDKLTGLGRKQDPPVVIHYIQPHTPFIGEISFKTNPNSTEENIIPPKEECDAAGPDYRMVEKGHISHEFARSAYMNNLRLVLRHATQLDQWFDNVVITADHGEALGPEEWSHGGLHDPRARTVPWMEL